MNRERAITLLDGTEGVVRPIRPSDRDALVEGFETLSPESRIRRFFYNKKQLSENELAQLSDPDGIDHIAFGLAVKLDGASEAMPIAVARCFRDEGENDLAEVAVVTADEWQGAGAGAELMRSLSAAAVEVGIRRWFAAMFADNTAIHHLLNRFGKKCEQRDLGNGVVEAIYEIVPDFGEASS